MPARRSKGAAEQRIDLQTIQQGGTTEQSVVEDTLKGILEAFQPYIPGIIKTLGEASQPTVGPDGVRSPGDVDAAKKALDFLSKALSGAKKDDTGVKMLALLAKMRGGEAADDDADEWE